MPVYYSESVEQVRHYQSKIAAMFKFRYSV